MLPPGAGRAPPLRRPDPRWRPRPPAPLARPVWQRQGSDFKALVSGREWALARPAFPTAPSRAPSLRPSLPRPRDAQASAARITATAAPVPAPRLRRQLPASPPAPPSHGPRRPPTARNPGAPSYRPLRAQPRGGSPGAAPEQRPQRPGPSPARLPAPLARPAAARPAPAWRRQRRSAAPWAGSSRPSSTT